MMMGGVLWESRDICTVVKSGVVCSLKKCIPCRFYTNTLANRGALVHLSAVVFLFSISFPCRFREHDHDENSSNEE